MNRWNHPLTPLKLGAVAFAVLWTASMLWWSGSLQPANAAILTVCGGVAGTCWYLAMRRWQLRRFGLRLLMSYANPARHGSPDPSATAAPPPQGERKQ